MFYGAGLPWWCVGLDDRSYIRLRRAGLVPGWVTVLGLELYWYLINHHGLLSLAVPSDRPNGCTNSLVSDWGLQKTKISAARVARERTLLFPVLLYWKCLRSPTMSQDPVHTVSPRCPVYRSPVVSSQCQWLCNMGGSCCWGLSGLKKTGYWLNHVHPSDRLSVSVLQFFLFSIKGAYTVKSDNTDPREADQIRIRQQKNRVNSKSAYPQHNDTWVIQSWHFLRGRSFPVAKTVKIIDPITCGEVARCPFIKNLTVASAFSLSTSSPSGLRQQHFGPRPPPLFCPGNDTLINFSMLACLTTPRFRIQTAPKSFNWGETRWRDLHPTRIYPLPFFW